MVFLERALHLPTDHSQSLRYLRRFTRDTSIAQLECEFQAIIKVLHCRLWMSAVTH